MKYIWGFDISLSNTGVSIFDENGKFCHIFSIDTSKKKNTGEKLKYIYDNIFSLLEVFPPLEIVIESGFTKFNKATQMIYRAHGIINLIFYKYEQFYYAPLSVKKTITGNGKSKKEDVYKTISSRYPEITFENYDQSDAFALCLCHLIKKGIIKYA